MGDHYQVLGVARDADPATIKAAYRKLAAMHHPDKGGDVETFKRLSVAYATLSDPEKRAYYDRTGADGPAQRSEMEEIAPLVVGAFDRAVVEALKGDKSRMGPGMGWPTPVKARGLGRTNIVSSMIDLLKADKGRGLEANKQLAHEMEQMREMLRRLGWNGEDGKNIIASALAQRIRDADEQTAKNEATIALVEKAIEHVRLYGWEMDPDPEVKVFHTGGILDTYARESLMDMMQSSMRGYVMPLGEPYCSQRIPNTFPDTPIKLKPPTQKSPKRRGATLDKLNGIYVRPHTCTLDAEDNQVPPPRGSWSAFEQQVVALQETA